MTSCEAVRRQRLLLGGLPVTAHAFRITSHYRYPRFLSIALTVSVLVLLAPKVSHATEPLIDRVEIQGLEGRVHHAKRGVWMDLPHSERLRTMALQERCTAIGGPRGKYRIANGQLWLDGLFRCGGDVNLRDVYPDSLGPMLATWVSGELVAELGRFICHASDGTSVFEKSARITVESGRVTALSYEPPPPTTACARSAP